MPKGKRRQRAFSWDGEVSGADENYMNGAGSNTTNYRVGASERERDSGNDHATDQVNDTRRQSRAPREDRRSSLAPWNQAVREVVQSMVATHRAINDLEEEFKSHMDDLGGMDETRNMLTRLKGECSEKDVQIKMLESTVATLRSMDSKAKADIDQSWAEIKKTRDKLDEDEIKQEKRVAAMIAQDRLKLTNEFERLTKEYDRSYAERRKELEEESSRMKAEKKQLVATVEAQSKTFEAQSKKLKDAVDQCDIWKRATESFKQEKQHLKKELQVIKEELALNPKPQEYVYVS
jgi:chromosome segregation ATPase